MVAHEPEASPWNTGVSPAGLYRVEVELEPDAMAGVDSKALRRGFSVEGKIVTRSGKISKLIWIYLRETLDLPN